MNHLRQIRTNGRMALWGLVPNDGLVAVYWDADVCPGGVDGLRTPPREMEQWVERQLEGDRGR